MQICVRLFAGFRAVAGIEELSLTLLPGANVRSALLALIKQQPELERELPLAGGRLPQHVNVFLNGKNVLVREGLDTPLSEGDVLALFPPVGGG